MTITFFSGSSFLLLIDDGTHFLDGLLSGFRREDAFGKEPGLQGGRADRNAFMLFKKFREMGKVGIMIFGTVNIDDHPFGLLKKRCRRLPASIVSNESSFALRFVFDD